MTLQDMMPRGEVGLICLAQGSQARILTPALEEAILLRLVIEEEAEPESQAA